MKCPKNSKRVFETIISFFTKIFRQYVIFVFQMAAETGPSVGCESKIENQILPKCDEKNELTLISSEIEKLRHHSESKGKKRRR